MTSALRDARVQQAMFRRVNRIMLVLWRLGLGRLLNAWPSVGGRMLVIVTVGRRSGRTRSFPLNYAPSDGAVYCAAGFGTRTHWYRNVLTHPDVEVWLPGGRWRGRVEPLRSDEHPAVLREVLIATGFAARLFEGIDARTLRDDELRALADRFPLVRVTLAERLNSPGDLAWVWTPVAAAFAALAARRGR